MASKTIVLITGANTGIGYEAAKALYNAPKAYQIIIGSRSVDNAKNAISQLEKEKSDSPSELDVVQVDLESDESIKKAFETVSSKYDRIDSLVNNGGASFDAKKDEWGTRKIWNKAYDINVAGTQVMTETFMPLLVKSQDPRLLFITSGMSSLTIAGDASHPRYHNPPAGWPKPPGFSAVSYMSSKTALNMMMLDWHRLLKNDDVKVWCISPGFLATGLGGNAEMLKKMGAGDPSIGGNFIKDVIEGKRDEFTGKVVGSGASLATNSVQAW